jgi:hypothetical protein
MSHYHVNAWDPSRYPKDQGRLHNQMQRNLREAQAEKRQEKEARSQAEDASCLVPCRHARISHVEKKS